MIAGNNECVIIDGGRHLRQASLFREFGEIIKSRYGIDLAMGEGMGKQISIYDFENILEEVCNRLYENMYKEISESFHAYD